MEDPHRVRVPGQGERFAPSEGQRSNPIQFLVLSAIVNGIAAGPFLIVMMLISGDHKIMGKYRNGYLAKWMGWATTVIMCAAGAYGVWFTIFVH